MPKPISRRNLLRAAGATVALPWMESMQAAAPATSGTRLAEPPLRMAFMFMPNGVYPSYWTPPGDGEDYEITPHLKPLADLKGDFLLLENLWNEKTAGRNGHWPKVPAFLHGGYVERSTGKDLDVGGVSVDQMAARHIGTRTPLPTFELGLEAPRYGIDNAGGGFARIYGSYISWRDPHTPVPKEIVPQLAFDRLFRGGTAPTVDSSPNDPAVISSMQRDDKSILDMVFADAKSLRSKISTLDKVKLDEYLESVRGVESRIEASMKPQKRWINEGKAPLDRPAAGVPEGHAEHLRLMLDILVLAFWSDSTRLATFMMGDAQSPMDYTFLPGVRGGFHTLSHHREEAEKRDQYAKVVTWQVEQFAYFLNKMKSLKEGNSTLLDNSMILFGSTLKDGNRHEIENLPLILAGRGKGAVRLGRRLRAPAKTPLCNLYLSMLHTLGIEEKSFGDSTGALKGLA